MKFSPKNAEIKEAFGMQIIEYCTGKNLFPIDCVIAHFRNNQYPWKINHGFYETFLF